MSLVLYRLAIFIAILGACLAGKAQATAKAVSATLSGSFNRENVPHTPGVGMLWHGLNSGFTYSQVHDSSIGWYNVFTPAVSFSLSSHYSVDVSLPIYPYRLSPVYPALPPALPSSQKLAANLGDLGDTIIDLHASFYPHALWSKTTASLTAPSGNRRDGLSTGKVTFDFSEHLERYVRRTGFIADMGVGDSSGLFNSLVTKDYSSLGPLAHFQAGAVLWLFGRNYIQSVAYEQLPMGGQTVYTAVGPAGISMPSGTGLSEDNGFTTYIGIPLTSHLSYTGYYNRSLRHNLDTASFGITYVLRGMPSAKHLSLIDQALREAAETNR